MPVTRPFAVVAALLLAACAGSPTYQAPELALPAAFEHAPATAGAAAIAADWWTVYEDAELDRLLRQVASANAELDQAEARWRQAMALVDAARAVALPQLGAGASVSRSGGGRAGSGAAAGGGAGTGSNGTLYAAGLDLAWTPDLWGRVARQRSAAEAGVQAQAALIDAARLALQLAAAQGYVRLRALDAQLALQGEAETAYRRSLQLTRYQYEAGLVARADVIQAETQLQSLRTQVFAIGRQRALEANALALLAGSVPAAHRIAAHPSGARPLPAMPPVPAALPAELLRRRPDLAAAERLLAAAHARWGVAQTAWLPDITLSASAGLQAGSLAGLLNAPARVWSLGPALAATLLDGGARRAVEAQALALYDEQAAAWRAGVLGAVRETEDALASLATLAGQEREQQRLVALAGDNERVVTYRYEAGEISFLEVATAQNLGLSARRSLLDMQAERLAASMQLIAALGGGWQAAR